MIEILRPSNDAWPSCLNEGPNPPIRKLYLVGRPPDPATPSIAIVGTRRPTAAGLHAASEIAGGLALEGYTVVSGLAVGIDAAAHRAALECGGKTVAVLGCGHEIDYPKRNRSLRNQIESEGSVLSEYPPETEAQSWQFPKRNRIIAALSLATVVIEGTIQSGALVTARLALDMNREVFAVPGSVRNVMAQGPNELIRRGEAGLVTRTAHVLEALSNLPAQERFVQLPSPELSESEATVLAYLDDVAVSIEAAARSLEMRPEIVARSMSMLELQGLAKRSFRGYIVSDKGSLARRNWERPARDTQRTD